MTQETELPAVQVKELPFEEYRRIHDIAAAAYEAATPVDYRYSALALRKAVDAAISALVPSTPAESRCEELADALQNVMGVYDTPLSRRRFPPDDFMNEALASARSALSSFRKRGEADE